jgi:hypothetical protein
MRKNRVERRKIGRHAWRRGGVGGWLVGGMLFRNRIKLSLRMSEEAHES